METKPDNNKFRLGEIGPLPVNVNPVGAVASNCVINFPLGTNRKFGGGRRKH